MIVKNKNIKQLAEVLPHRTFSLRGRPNEPITLIIFGSWRQIERQFLSHKWYKAISLNPLSALKAAGAAVFDMSYLSGPVSPSFINRKPQTLAFQRPTKSNTFRRRHHLRLWKTHHHLDGKRVWVGMLSYDRSTGFYKHSLYPTHHISANLDSEENFLARTLSIKQPKFVRLSDPEMGVISNGDPYVWDGKALVLDFSDED